MKPLPMAGCHGARPVSCWSVLIAPDVLEHGVKNLGGPVKESSKGLDSPLLLFSKVARRHTRKPLPFAPEHIVVSCVGTMPPSLNSLIDFVVLWLFSFTDVFYPLSLGFVMDSHLFESRFTYWTICSIYFRGGSVA